MKRPLVALALIGIASSGLAGCKDKESGDGDDVADLEEGEESAELGTEDETGAASEWGFAPIYGSPNLDDDDQSGKQDWLELVFDGDDEVYALSFTAEQTAAVGDGKIRLTLVGDAENLRVWHQGMPVLGSNGATPATTYEFRPDAAEVSLPLELGNFLARGELTIDRLDADGNVRESDTIELVASPLIMNHHLQPAEHLWVIQTNDNAPFVSGFEAALGSDVTAVPGAAYQYDRWLQDEIEFAFSTDPAGRRLDTVIDSIRDRGLDDFAEDLFTMPNWHIGTWGNPINATTFDSFGNLDAAPPVEGYPFGRIYYGLEGNEGMDGVLADFLAVQTLQEPFPVDTAWLCVGHVDEFSSFIPDPSAPKGFRLLLSDTTSAYELLDNLDPSWPITRYASPYGYSTAAELTGDAGLRALNEDIQANELDPLRAKFTAELGLTDEDIIEIPTVFEQLQGCGPYMVALTPGTVNLIVANLEGKGVKLMVPDPFFRDDAEGPEVDPIAQDFEARMPEGIEVVWIDDWYSYHLLDGEVHCGTNVTRTPLADWWTEGAELLGLGGGN